MLLHKYCIYDSMCFFKESYFLFYYYETSIILLFVYILIHAIPNLSLRSVVSLYAPNNELLESRTIVIR